MMHKIIIVLFAFIFIGCRSDDNKPQNTTVSIVGSWKPVRYEFHGKTYSVTDCQKKSELLVNSNMTGYYDSYYYTTMCEHTASYTGSWHFDQNNEILSISYIDNGVTKTKTFTVSNVSSTELSLLDNSHDIDGIAGNDNAELVFKKQ